MTYFLRYRLHDGPLQPGQARVDLCPQPQRGLRRSQYRTFPADADGIIPITELAWFPDDATERFVEFIGKAWPREHLEENLKFIADSLGANRDEHPRDTIRRYLATGFYKDHCKPTRSAPSTGSFPAANSGRSSAWSISTATTRAPWPGCGRNT